MRGGDHVRQRTAAQGFTTFNRYEHCARDGRFSPEKRPRCSRGHIAPLMKKFSFTLDTVKRLRADAEQPPRPSSASASLRTRAAVGPARPARAHARARARAGSAATAALAHELVQADRDREPPTPARRRRGRGPDGRGERAALPLPGRRGEPRSRSSTGSRSKRRAEHRAAALAEEEAVAPGDHRGPPGPLPEQAEAVVSSPTSSPRSRRSSAIAQVVRLRQARPATSLDAGDRPGRRTGARRRAPASMHPRAADPTAHPPRPPRRPRRHVATTGDASPYDS